jgi:hypothetical protein
MVGISGERASIEEGARRLMADVRQGIHYEARECLVLAPGMRKERRRREGSDDGADQSSTSKDDG